MSTTTASAPRRPPFNPQALATVFRDRAERVKQAANGRMADLLEALAPGARWQGNYAVVPNPTRADDRPGSFVVWRNGAWIEYDEDQRGDLIDLVVYTGRATSRGAAIRLLEGLLGLGPAQELGAPVRDPVADEARRREREERDAARTEAKAAHAVGLWFDAQPLDRGCPAALYLRHRMIDLVRLGRVPKPLRWDVLAHPETGEVVPALLSLMSGPDGRPRAVHRTFLTYDGRKYPDGTAKMMLGPVKGCAVRLWRGASRLTPAELEAQGLVEPLHLVEGIENALSLAVSVPEVRVWALGSLAGFSGLATAWAGQVPAWVSEVVLWPDNDRADAPATRAFEMAQRQWQRLLPTRVARVPQQFKDLNDALRGIARTDMTPSEGGSTDA